MLIGFRVWVVLEIMDVGWLQSVICSKIIRLRNTILEQKFQNLRRRKNANQSCVIVMFVKPFPSFFQGNAGLCKR
jgi:hypothetical protein